MEKKKRFFREVGVIPRFVFIIDITRRILYYSTIKSLLQPNVSIRKEKKRKMKVAESLWTCLTVRSVTRVFYLQVVRINDRTKESLTDEDILNLKCFGFVKGNWSA